MKTIYLIPTFILTVLVGSITAQNCTVNGGIDQSNCVTSIGELKGNASGLFSTAAHWMLVSGPSLQINNPDSLTTTFSGYKVGNTYKFKIAATCKDGISVEDHVSIKFSLLPNTPNANSNQTQCTINGLSIKLAGSSLNSDETGLWGIVTGGVGKFSDSSSPTSNFILSGNNCINSTDVVLRWSVTNENCSLFDDVTITYIGGAPVDAGSHQNLTCAIKAKLAGSCPGSGNQIGVWTLIDGPGGGTFGNKNTYNTTLADLQIGTYLLKWSVSGSCVTDEDTVSVTILTLGMSTKVSASPNQNVCIENLPLSFTIVGSPVDSGLTGTWTQTSGKTTTIVNENSASTAVTGINASGAYSYKWTLSKGLCSVSAVVTITVSSKLSADGGLDIIAQCGASSATMLPITKIGSWAFVSGPSIPTISGNVITKLFKNGKYKMKYTCSNLCGQETDTVTIIVSSAPSSSKAGTDQIFACNVVSGTLAANFPLSGNGFWSQTSGPNTANITDIQNPSTCLTGLIGGRYTMKWEISGGSGCVSTVDEVIIYVSTNAPTIANAGIDQTISKNTILTLKGNAASPQEIGAWSQIEGTLVVIDSPKVENCHITGLKDNSTYKFVWKISNACGSSTDTVMITVIPDSKAGADASYCNTSTINIYGSSPGVGNGVWRQVSGPACTITGSNSEITSVTGMIPGIYKFDWAITIGSQVSNDTITITNFAPTSANAGLHQEIVNANSITLNGNFPKQGSGTWSTISGLTARIISPSSPISLVIGLSKGEYLFRWTVSNGLCSDYSDVSVTVLEEKFIDSSTLVQHTDPRIYVPNAFTPNADGLNDKFGPTTSGVDKYTMALYNRWGQQIYIGCESDGGWDGTFRDKECQQEVYVYEIVYESKKSSTFLGGETLRGTVTLLR